MHCVTVNLTPAPCARPSVQVPQAEEGKAAHDVEEPCALRARPLRAGTRALSPCARPSLTHP
eukprot:4511574-Prymnesium_polylepis.1